MIYKYSRFPFYLIIAALFLSAVPSTADASALRDADHDLFRYINEDMESGFLDVTTPVIQRMGDSQFYAAACMLLLAFGDEKMAETGKLASAAFLQAGFIAYGLKKIVRRPRPLDEDEKSSFPSGHSTLAFTMATVAGHEYPKLRIPLYFCAFGTAFSRVYQGRHYPSDVIAGAIIGTLTGLQMVHYKKPILSFSF